MSYRLADSVATTASGWDVPHYANVSRYVVQRKQIEFHPPHPLRTFFTQLVVNPYTACISKYSQTRFRENIPTSSFVLFFRPIE